MNKTYIKKFRIKFPIGTVIKLVEHKIYALKPIESIALILDIDESEEIVTMLINNRIQKSKIRYVNNCAKTIQRPFGAR